MISKITGMVALATAAWMSAGLSISASPQAAQICPVPWRCLPAPPAGTKVIDGVTVGPDFFAPMTFAEGPAEIGGRRQVFAVGEIQADSTARLRSVVAQLRLPAGSVIVLHSPGGSLAGGVDIGRLIRAQSFETVIAQRIAPDSTGLFTRQAGLCVSACSLAFLGGVQRSAVLGSGYGVHAAFAGGSAPPDALTVGQQLAAQVGAYVREMGVQPAFLEDMTSRSGAAGEVLYMTRERMTSLKVITTFSTTWDVRTTGNGFLLVGSNGESSKFPGNREQVVFECGGTPRTARLGVYFMPEDAHLLDSPSNRMAPGPFVSSVTAVSVSAFRSTASLSSQPQPVTFRLADLSDLLRVADAHHVSAFVPVTPAIRSWIATADVLSFSFAQQFGQSTGVSVDIAAGRTAALNFLNSCR